MEPELPSADHQFAPQFSDQNFWDKVLKYGKVAGAEVVQKALELYYAAQDPRTPTWAKTVIIGALGYFITPLDALPDVAPLVGFTDDLGVLAMAMATVATYITPEIRERARAKLKEWFG